MQYILHCHPIIEIGIHFLIYRPIGMQLGASNVKLTGL
jgi:hypothetical protein